MPDIGITWLEHKFYVIDNDLNGYTKIRIFNDQAPFEESPDSIHLLERAFDAYDITSSKISRALFIIGDGLHHEYIIKIRMPRRKVTRRRIEGYPACLSITPNNELLVVMNEDDLSDDFVIRLYRLKDLTEKKCIPLPSGIESVSCAAQLPNKELHHFLFNGRSPRYILHG